MSQIEHLKRRNELNYRIFAATPACAVRAFRTKGGTSPVRLAGIDFGQVLVQLLPHMIQINDARATAAKERRMRNIVDEAGEIVAMASDEHTLIGGHHRLAVAASAGKQLYWKDTGEPVKLDPFFKGSSRRHTA